MIEYLEWDSSFFGFRIGKYLHKGKAKKIPSLNMDSYDLIYIFSDVKLDSQYRLVDTKVTFEKITSGHVIDNSIKVFNPLIHSYDTLLQLVYLSGHQSRFLNDSFFGVDAFRRLYKKWIDKILQNEEATTLVYVEDDHLLGFISYLMQDNNYHIDFIAVAGNARGKGIGKKLIVTAETLIGPAKRLTVPTQETNLLACNFYNKMGFTIRNKKYIYHYVVNSL